MKTTHPTPPEPKDFSNNPGSGSPTLGMAKGYAAGRVPGGARPVVPETQDGKTQDTRLRAAMRMLVICLCLPLAACMTAMRETTSYPDGRVVSRSVAGILGTDADNLVVDGPPASIIAWQPVTNAEGVTTGYKPLYGSPLTPGGGNALISAYGLNQSKGLGKVTSAALGYGISVVAGNVQKSKDAAEAANAGRQIDAASAAEQARLANEAQAQAFRHAETMEGLKTAVPVP